MMYDESFNGSHKIHVAPNKTSGIISGLFSIFIHIKDVLTPH